MLVWSKMSRVVGCFYRLAYYYMLAFGLLRFEYDFRNNDVRRTRRVALYSLCVNLLMLSQIPQQFQMDISTYTQQSKARDIYQFLHSLIVLSRIFACLLILVFYWLRRYEIIALVADFLRLRRAQSRYLSPSASALRRFHFALLIKFSFSITGDLVRFLMSWRSTNWQDRIIMMFTAIYIGLNNQVFNHFFVVSRLINLYLETINSELQHLVSAASELNSQRIQRRHILPWRSAQLMNKFNALMSLRQKLQRFALRVNRLLGPQIAGVMLALYCYNVGVCYIIYSLMKPHEASLLDISAWNMVVLVFGTVVYIADVTEFLVISQRLRQNFGLCMPITLQLLELQQLEKNWDRSVNMKRKITLKLQAFE